MPDLSGVGLALLEGEYAICRIDPAEDVPGWATAGPGQVLSVTRTAEELSIVCADEHVPAECDASRGWGAMRVRSRLDHSLTGVMASLAAPLARVEVPIFAISTFDTDYVLFPCQRLEEAVEALENAGHTFH